MEVITVYNIETPADFELAVQKIRATWDVERSITVTVEEERNSEDA